MVIDAFLACLFNVHHLIFLSMVYEYAYFFMNIFGNRSIADEQKGCPYPLISFGVSDALARSGDA